MQLYPNYEIAGRATPGSPEGGTIGISCDTHDGKTEYIVPFPGVTTEQAAARWFELSYGDSSLDFTPILKRAAIDWYYVERA